MHELLGAALKEIQSGAFRELTRFGGCTARGAAQQLATVERTHEPPKDGFASTNVAVAGDRRVAVGAEGAHEKALGFASGAGCRVVDGREEPSCGGIRESLHTDGSLAGGWQDNFVRQVEGLRWSEAQTHESRFGKNESIELAARELTEAGIDIATHIDHLEIGTQVEELAAAPEARCANARPHGERFERGDRELASTHENIAWLFARQDRGQDEPLGRLRWQILEAVDSGISTAVRHRTLNLADEDAFVAERAQRLVRRPIGLRGHDDDLRRHRADPALKSLCDQLSLRQGQRAAARG